MFGKMKLPYQSLDLQNSEGVLFFHSKSIAPNFFKSSPEDLFLDCREGGRVGGGEREKERNTNVRETQSVASLLCVVVGVRARVDGSNIGM